MNILKFIVSFYFGLAMYCATADELNKQNTKCEYVNFVVAEHLLKNHCLSHLGCNVSEAKRKWNQLAKTETPRGCFKKIHLFDVFAAGYKIPATDISNIEKRRKWERKFNDSFFTPLVNILADVSFIENAVTEEYDGHKTDTCTPSIYTGQNNESKAICTTERYVTDPAFQKAMDTKFRLEGGCAPVKDGNCFTCYGVGAKWNNEVAQLKNDNSDMFFNMSDAEKIAYDKYYYPKAKPAQQIKRLPPAISGDVFMAKWGSGNASQSIGLLQEILGVKADGMIGNQTIVAAQEYRGDLRKLFLQKRWLTMKNNKSFADGWRKAFNVYLKNGCYSTASAGDVILKRQNNDPRCTQTRNEDIAKLANYIQTGHSVCLDQRLNESNYDAQKEKIPVFKEKLRLDIQSLEKTSF